MEKLSSNSLDSVNGGMSITKEYDLSNSAHINELREEFRKNNQKRNIDLTYAEYVELVDKGIIEKEDIPYNFAKTMI